jgi:deoxyribodipyrimidine photolyase-related protein
MTEVNLLFPHQLFQKHELLENKLSTFLIEEHLFFNEFNFHKMKLAFQRASMKSHLSLLIEKEIKVEYIEAQDDRSDVRKLIDSLAQLGVKTIHYIDPTDNWLSRRVKESAGKNHIALICYENPSFINSLEDLSTFFRKDKKSFFQTTFYKQQRLKHNILLENGDQPAGGKWSFDGDNRKKYPKGKTPPTIQYPSSDTIWEEAVAYVKQNYANNIGELNSSPIYPYTLNETNKWLNQFFEFRFHGFGDYEDAIVVNESILHHSVLTPMLNVGLIEPKEIIEKAVVYATKNGVALNSLEGFVRQIMGWREFIRGMYECKGVESRNSNFWGFNRKIPASFYNGTTGIGPVDETIKRVLKDGYCHHIERLMILGNFMLLCEFHPKEVYRWFMEFFIDAYDWVMVPNVYGMSQFADGGFFATKPYISGSNYVMKMSNHPKGEWQQVWDGLFWRFMHVNRDFFLKNPRLGMLVRTFDKMSPEKQASMITTADDFLNKLDDH